MRRILVRKCNDIPFISFFHIPHSSSPRAYSSFYSNTVKGKVGENSNFEGLDVHQGVGKEISALQSKTAAEVLGHQICISTHKQQMDPAKQAKVLQDFPRQSAQLDMTQMDPAKQAKAMQDFPRQSAKLDITATEMISNAIDDATDNDEAKVETGDIFNQQMDPAKQAKAMQDFSRQSAKLDIMATGMISNAIDDATDNDEAKVETRDIFNQIFVMLGVGVPSQHMAPAKHAKVKQDFPRQSTELDIMRAEMISNAIDNARFNEEAEEVTEDLTNQDLDEIGVDVASQLVVAPKGKIARKRIEEMSSSETEEMLKIVNEIGVDVTSQLVAPKGKIAGKRIEELSRSEIEEMEVDKILDEWI